MTLKNILNINRFKISLILIAYLFIFNVFTYSQNNKIDSLLKVLKIEKNDTSRVKINIEIADLYKSFNTDSSIYFYKSAYVQCINANSFNFKAPVDLKYFYTLQSAKSLKSIGNIHFIKGEYDLAVESFIKSLKIFNSLNRIYSDRSDGKKGMSQCYNNIGMIYSSKGDYTKSLEYHTKSLKINEELGDKKGSANCYNNIGNIYNEQGSYDKAIECFLKALKINEELKDKKGMSSCYNNISIVHRYQFNYDQAIEYCLMALKIYEELSDQKGISQVYNNIGINYYNKGYKLSSLGNDSAAKLDYSQSVDYYMKSLKILEEVNDYKGMSYCYNNIGLIHRILENYQEAIEFYLKSLKIKEELGDKKGIATVYVNIANLHLTLVDSVPKSKLNSIFGNKTVNLNKALEYGNKAMEYATEIESASLQLQVSFLLKIAYEKIGNYKKALEFANIFIQTEDTIFSEEKTKAITDAEKKFETEKKQLQIEKLNKEKELQDESIARKNAESKKQKVIIWFVVSILLLVLSFSVFIYRLFLQKKKSNILVMQKNQSLELAYAEINTQKEEIRAQRDEIEIQRDRLSDQKKAITDSIYYAKRIQQAILPSNSILNSDDGRIDSFIFFRPKDIVSGDFYWATKLNDLLIVTVADCTGHGVPGAFMSMLGVSYLNEIVRKKEITKASEVLDQLRMSIIEALQQKGDSGEQKDGMDISLLAIDLSKSDNSGDYNAQWSGANNSLYILRKNINKLENNGKPVLEEIEPDKQPVAIYEKMNPFVNHKIVINKGDIVYLISDGFVDQFGGPQNKKFKIKQLKELFLSISENNMCEQKIILENTFESWRGLNEQVDDVTILGLSF